MSKIIRNLSFICLLLIALISILSCNNLFLEKESISFDRAVLKMSVAERSILPMSPTEADVVRYVLKGTKSGGSEETLGTWDATADATAYSKMIAATVNVDAGTWSFSLSAYKKVDSSYVEILSDIVSNKVISQGTNTLAFSLKAVEGFGDFSVTIYWPAVEEVAIVKAGLFDLAGTAVSGYSLESITIQQGTGTHINEKYATYSKTGVSSGTYLVRYYFFQNMADSTEITKNIGFWQETVTIVAGGNGTASRTIESLNSAYEINYDLGTGETGWLGTPVTTYTQYAAVTIPSTEKPYRNGYIFSGWAGNTTIPLGSTGTKTFTAQWEESVYVDSTNKEIFANGKNLLITSSGTGTAIYIDANENGSVDYTIGSINGLVPADGGDYSAYTIYGGKKATSTASADYTGDIVINVTGGKVKNIHAAGKANSSNTANTTGNATITFTGGTVTGNVSCENVSGTKKVNVSGTALIGNKTSEGIILATLTEKKVTVSAVLYNSDGGVTLITDTRTAGTTVASLDNTNYAGATYFTSLVKSGNGNSYITQSLEKTDLDIKLAAGVMLPAAGVGETGEKLESFTLGTDVSVQAAGTIFSVSVKDGSFTVGSTSLVGAEFETATLVDGTYTTTTGSGAFDTNTNYTYIQFKSSSGSISQANVETYVKGITFYRDGTSGAYKDITVKINLETVPLSEINNTGVTYFDGSFYKIVTGINNNTTNPITNPTTWQDAYNAAKAPGTNNSNMFNGLKGYLMTVTSYAENYFVYNTLGATAAWIRSEEHTSELQSH